jgi:hypothetical protein
MNRLPPCLILVYKNQIRNTPYLFQWYKKGLNTCLPTYQSTRRCQEKRQKQPKGGFTFHDCSEEPEPKNKAPEFDTSIYPVEAISPAIDPTRVLLRRVFS